MKASDIKDAMKRARALHKREADRWAKVWADAGREPPRSSQKTAEELAEAELRARHEGDEYIGEVPCPCCDGQGQRGVFGPCQTCMMSGRLGLRAALKACPAEAAP